MPDKNVKYKKTAIEAALIGGAFIKNSLGRIRDISYKGKSAKNIVTDVDKKSEEMIIDKILSDFPDHSILSEERGQKEAVGIFKWLIDPLDGTSNFSRGFPFFAVSIGLEKKGRIILGAVYDPVRDELFFAEEGKGAYLNNKRIHVSGTKRLSDAFLATGFAYEKARIRANIKYFRNFLLRSFAVRRPGSAALDFSYVACGRCDGFWELYLNPWDCAAGSIIVEEAGGKITKFDGSRYSHYDNEVLTTNGLIHKQMVEVFSFS